MTGRLVGMFLVSDDLRAWLPPAAWDSLPADATFAIVARSEDKTVTVLATDSDVPTTVDPETYGRRFAGRWVGVQRDLLYYLGKSGWTAWDSYARTEEYQLPEDCRFPWTCEAGDFVIRAEQPVAA
jgi:hypothetical protein